MPVSATASATECSAPSGEIGFDVAMVSVPPSRHGVARVHDEVHEHLLDAGRVGVDRGDARVEVQVDVDAGAHELQQHLVRGGDHVVQVDDLGIVGAAPAVREEILGERGGLGRRPLHRREPVAGLAEHAQVVVEQLGVAAHHREEVVEVVGDVAGEPPDRFHLLRVEQLLLEALAAGDVVEQHEAGVGVAVEPADARLVDLDPHDLVVGRDVPLLDRHELHRARRELRELVLPAAVVDVVVRFEPGADELLARGAQHLAQRRVGIDDHAVERGERHPDRRRVERAAELVGRDAAVRVGEVTLVERGGEEQQAEQAHRHEHLENEDGRARRVTEIDQRPGLARDRPVGDRGHRQRRGRHAAQPEADRGPHQQQHRRVRERVRPHVEREHAGDEHRGTEDHAFGGVPGHRRIRSSRTTTAARSRR